MICSKNIINNGEKCQIKCNFAYEARGSYICHDRNIENSAICESNDICVKICVIIYLLKVKSCKTSPLHSITNGKIKCSKSTINHDENCQIKCDFGYETNGNYGCNDGTIQNSANCQSNIIYLLNLVINTYFKLKHVIRVHYLQ